MSQPDLSIVLPCYHPPTQWQEHIIASLTDFEQHYRSYELIIVNDGCHTEAVQDISLLRQHFPLLKWISYPQNRGKGYAIRQGVAEASAPLIIYTDIDFPYTSGSFLDIYHTLLSGNTDIAVGVKDEVYYSKVPWFRKRISKTLTRLIRMLIRISITDTQCGLKGLNAAAKPLLLSGTIDRYLFDLEFIYKAERRKLRLKAVPVRLRDGVQFSAVNWKILFAEAGNFLRIWRSR